MNNDKINTAAIKQILNHSVTQMDRDTIDNLRNARNNALARQRALQQAPVTAWFAQHGLLLGSSPLHHKKLNWALALVLAACLISSATYLQQTNEHDHSDIDLAILTDDLPVDAYVD